MRGTASLALVFSLAVAGVAVTFGGIVLRVSVAEWIDHRQRIQDWHELSLANYAELGAETVEQVSEWEFTSENPAHVLLTALWVHQRLQESGEPAYTVRNLSGPMFLAGRRVGTISKGTAERMGQKFAQLGLIAGRKERQAGVWVPRTADAVIYAVLRNWN